MAEEILRGLNTAQRAAVASPSAVLQILAPRALVMFLVTQLISTDLV